MAESPAQTAFAEEALTHLDTLYRGALRLTRDPDQAQDLVQEAYLRALRYQHSYQPGTNMKAWLFAIMRNLFWDRFKGSRKDDVSLDDTGDFVLYEKLRDEGARPEADVLDKLAASEVRCTERWSCWSTSRVSPTRTPPRPWGYPSGRSCRASTGPANSFKKASMTTRSNRVSCAAALIWGPRELTPQDLSSLAATRCPSNELSRLQGKARSVLGP